MTTAESRKPVVPTSLTFGPGKVITFVFERMVSVLQQCATFYVYDYVHHALCWLEQAAIQRAQGGGAKFDGVINVNTHRHRFIPEHTRRMHMCSVRRHLSHAILLARVLHFKPAVGSVFTYFTKVVGLPTCLYRFLRAFIK